MNRRNLMKNISLGAVAAGAMSVVGLAQAQSKATVVWRCQTSFPKSVDTLDGAARMISEIVKKLTGGKFEIQVFAAGEIAPALQALDVTKDGTVECSYTCGYYYPGKDISLAIDTAVPFGLLARQQQAWFYQGNGLKLLREVYADQNVINFPAGNTNTQMGGWFRKDILSVDDLKGLKMRIPGLGGKVMAKLGVTPVALPGNEIYTALEKGTIDGTEWVGPYDDEKLGLQKVAPFYKYPGFQEPGAQVSFLANKDAYNKLPQEFKDALEAACRIVNSDVMSKYDALNPLALAKLMQSGAKVGSYPKDMLIAAKKAAEEVLAEEANNNVRFKAIMEDMSKFQRIQNAWLSTNDFVMQQINFGKI